MSYFGRVNYTYDGKYIIEASIRRDGSSRFGSANRFGTFPSISAAYRISEEPFMAPLQDLISDLKLRVSHGSTGNQDGIDNFGSLTQYSGGAFYNGRPAIYKSSVGNTDLRWENTVSTNLGLDVGLLNNRIELIVDAYVRVTNDLFYSLALPRTTGFTEIRRVNLGSLENRGVELMMTSYNLTGDFSWNTSFNIAFNRNKITDLLEFNGISDRVIAPNDIGDAEGPYGLFRIGEPTGNFYGYKWLGIWGTPEYTDIPAEWGANVKPGDVVFEDVNDNFRYGRIDDHQLIGNALPLHTGGFTNNFAYKGVDLNIVMNWSYGNDIYNMSRAVMESMASLRNQLATTADRWSPNNTNATIPRAFQGANSASGAANNDANSSFVEDGSFLRVRNVTLGYNLPETLTDKIALSNARIYVSAQNLFTFTNYTGLDPENQNLGASQGGIPSLGIDFLTQPQPRVFMVGVNVGL
jgi:TonB-linked SusC/RagA family outer membrane protein